MSRLLQKLMCVFFGHQYFVMRRMNLGARKVGCHRCGAEWGMHDETRAFVPWDSDLEALYSSGGPLDPEYDPRSVAFGNKKQS